MKIYFDFRDWWIGYYRGNNYHFICPLPTLVIRWKRKPPYGYMYIKGTKVPIVDMELLKNKYSKDDIFWSTSIGQKLVETYREK